VKRSARPRKGKRQRLAAKPILPRTNESRAGPRVPSRKVTYNVDVPRERSEFALNAANKSFAEIHEAHRAGDFISAFIDWVRTAEEAFSYLFLPGSAHQETGRHLQAVLCELQQTGRLAPCLDDAIRSAPGEPWVLWETRAILCAALEAKHRSGVPLAAKTELFNEDACTAIWKAVPFAKDVFGNDAYVLLKWREQFNSHSQKPGPRDGHHNDLYSLLIAELDSARALNGVATLEQLCEAYLTRASQHLNRLPRAKSTP
jgi:hypothetical protein